MSLSPIRYDRFKNSEKLKSLKDDETKEEVISTDSILNIDNDIES